MHEYAEFGLAAHWIYKENNVKNTCTAYDAKISLSSSQPNGLESEGYFQDDVHQKYSSITVGHPVLRVEGSQLLPAVIVRFGRPLCYCSYAFEVFVKYLSHLLEFLVQGR